MECQVVRTGGGRGEDKLDADVDLGHGGAGGRRSRAGEARGQLACVGLTFAMTMMAMLLPCSSPARSLHCWRSVGVWMYIIHYKRTRRMHEGFRLGSFSGCGMRRVRRVQYA